MTDNLRVLLGKRLKEARKTLGLTQKELASKVEGKVDYTYIGRIERGEQFPSLKMLQKIGKALSLPLSYFFEESEGKAEREVIVSHLGKFFKRGRGKDFFDLLSRLHPDDIDFLMEIAKLLSKHRKSHSWDELRVAESEEGYSNHREMIEEIEAFIEKEEREEVRSLLEKALRELRRR